MDELERLILDALKEAPERELSLSFTDALLDKVEKRLWWREHLQAFGIKTAIITGTLGLILLLMVSILSEASQPFLLLLKTNWQVIAGVVLLIFFTSFSDQVLLKYFNRRVLKEAENHRQEDFPVQGSVRSF